MVIFQHFPDSSILPFIYANVNDKKDKIITEMKVWFQKQIFSSKPNGLTRPLPITPLISRKNIPTRKILKKITLQNELSKLYNILKIVASLVPRVDNQRCNLKVSNLSLYLLQTLYTNL